MSPLRLRTNVRRFALTLLLIVLIAPSADAQVTFRDASDRAAFFRWVVLLADAQFYRPTPDVGDCAALVRHAVREALRSSNPDWRRHLALPLPVATPGPVRARVSEDQGLRLFRVTRGAAAGYAEFADARTLVTLNSRPVGRDLSALRPGDLLYFRRESSPLPDHVMLYVGPSAFEPEGRDWVVYHTGPSRGDGAGAVADPGEVRKVRLADLVRHPSPAWRPVAANRQFVGIFRMTVGEP